MNRVLYIDDYHLSDPLFLQSLARGLARAGAGLGPTLAVHGSGEDAERLLEGEGLFVDRRGGVLAVETAEEAALVARSLRQTNRRLVGLFTDAVVAVVGLPGGDRRLLVVEPDGRLTVPETGWVEKILARGVVPIVAAYAREADGGRAGEVPAIDAVLALARALGVRETTVAAFTTNNLPGVMAGKQPRPTIPLDEFAEAPGVPDPAGLARLVEAGVEVLLTNTTRLADPVASAGTRVVP